MSGRGGTKETKMNMASERAAPETVYSKDQERVIRAVAETIHRLNTSIVEAVAAGLSVEVMRVSRHHSADGCWGDQSVPIISRSP